MGHIYPWYLVVYETESPEGRERHTERFDRLKDAQKVFDTLMNSVKEQPLRKMATRTLNVDLFGCDCLASCRPDSHPNAPLQSS